METQGNTEWNRQKETGQRVDIGAARKIEPPNMELAMKLQTAKMELSSTNLSTNKNNTQEPTFLT
jgi:hypothetical protein